MTLMTRRQRLQLRRGPLLIICLALTALLWAPSTHAQAQASTSAAYWQYNAPGRIDHLAVGDINGDSIDEIIVAAEDTSIDLVDASGRQLWRTPVQIDDPVVALAVLMLTNSDAAPATSAGIVVATTTSLILLDPGRTTIWNVPLTTVPRLLQTVNLGNTFGILLVDEAGRLSLYNEDGLILWRYAGVEIPGDDPRPLMTVADFDQDGRDDIAYTYFTARGFSEVAVIDENGINIFRRALEGYITAVGAVPFQPEAGPRLALGTHQGNLHLYDIARNEKRWLRTPSVDVAITSITDVPVADGRLLVLGTDSGKVIGYNEQGQRLWGQNLNLTADRAVLNLSGSPVVGGGQSFSVALTLAAAPDNEPVQSEVILLDSRGQPLLDTFSSASTASLTRLVDINHDNLAEVLLVGFGTVQLLDPGIGAGENFDDWEYLLDARPQSVLTLDVEQDGEEELLLGAQDGRLHLLQSNGTARWIEELSGVITNLDFIPNAVNRQGAIVVAHNSRIVVADGSEQLEGRLDLLQVDGNPFPFWGGSKAFPASITSLLLHDISNNGRPEIIVGTSSGQTYAYRPDGRLLWETSLSGGVAQLVKLPLQDRGRQALLAGSQSRQLLFMDNKGRTTVRAAYLQDIDNILWLEGDPTIETRIIVITEDGITRGLDNNGSQLWELDLSAIPTLATLADERSVLIATDDNELIRLALDGSRSPEVQWRIPEMGRITALFWGDLDGDNVDDVAIGNRTGDVVLFSSDGANQWDTLQLGSSVFHIAAMRRGFNQANELAVVTGNGVVRHFRAQANRPPLLIRPQIEVAAGRYSIGISVINVEENDDVQVTLELFDPAQNRWLAQDTRTASDVTPLLWQLDPEQLADEAIRFRFIYNDGSHIGRLEPTVGPVPIRLREPINPYPILLAVTIISLGDIAFLYWQTQTMSARVRRFYQRMQKQPAASLSLLEAAYNFTRGAPDFLLNLASRARQDDNLPIASLAEGLFLLGDRPEAALGIINAALAEAEDVEPPWTGSERWSRFFTVAEGLLAAPSLTELSLLQPQLVHFLAFRGRAEKPSTSIDALLPILNSLRDSERVETVEDRLVYLNEALVLLRQLSERLYGETVAIDTRVLTLISNRWTGLIKAQVDSLRGQARLDTQLKTRRIVPEQPAIITLELKNIGRAPAENVEVRVLANPAYWVKTQPEIVPLIPPGRVRRISCTIVPNVTDRFRLACEIHFDDRMQADRHFPFGDMIHLLPPVHDFQPVRNPYAPGTPLRRNSTVFFGREDVFEFIADVTIRRDQQNVLILVGQRRTGKTSMLLRLGEHLPPNLVPIYIDCQSLGVNEGMDAFFHDISWLMADALEERDISLEVPTMAEWRDNPANYFQRQFIPQILSQLPDEAQLLLVFDEFEALEDLVKKDILPPTLFTYLRHLMQHARGLSFVFVGTRRLEEMTANYWSVLFNIALYKEIGFLSREATEKLITRPVAPGIIYDDLALDKIWRVTAGQPYFLQLVCYTLINQANKAKNGYVTISDVNAGLDEMLRLGEVHFAYIWQLSTATERALLTAVSHHVDQDTPFHPIDLVQYLDQYGLHLEPTEVTTGLNRLVERDIMREITVQGTHLYELKIGLIGLWTARNKSLSKLYESSNGTPAPRRAGQPTSY